MLLQAALGLCFAQQPAPAQPDDFKITREPPRVLVNARRLRLLRRERERSSMRWEQFHALMAGIEQMREPGFAYSLYYLASGQTNIGKTAIRWALGPAKDLRQLALVYDWCRPLLAPGEAETLRKKIANIMEAEKGLDDVPAVRSRVLAAVALADDQPDLSEATLSAFFEKWWLGKMVPALNANRTALANKDVYPLFEILHTIRDNLNFDMRDNARIFFRDLPLYRVLTYYPAVFPAAENLYRIPQYAGTGDPDLDEAALARAADLSIVAFDTNALEHQFLQGWLIQDRFLMRGPFGIPYEFFWANPYQPGLSYYHLPLFYHDPKAGLLLIRSSWEEDAVWLSYSRAGIELFMDGKRSGLSPASIREPLEIGDTLVMMGQSPMQWQLNLPQATRYFLIGLKPDTWYELEVDDEELREEKTDAGGILALQFPKSVGVGVRLRESGYRSNHAEPSR